MAMPPSHDPPASAFTKKHVFAGIVATLSVIFVLLLLAEGVVRVRQWWLYGSLFQLEDVKVRQDVGGLDIPKPGYETRSIRINSLGFRGPELVVPKPAGTLRLAFLGGSTTFCAEVSSNEAVWAHRVWHDLQQRYPKIRIDYVNAGVTAYTTLHSLGIYKQQVAQLQPDVVFIYHATNDMTYEVYSLAESQGLVSRPKPTSWLGRYSLLWFLVEKNYQIRVIQDNKKHIESLPDDFGHSFAVNLTQLIQEVKQGVDLVAVITWSQQMRQGHTKDVNRRAAASAQFYMPSLAPEQILQGYARYNGVIRRVARETGSVLIADEDRIPGDPVHFNDSVHFTDAGSRVMAERVIDGLLADPRWHEFVRRFAERHPDSVKTAP